MSDAPVGSVEDEARRLGEALRRARRGLLDGADDAAPRAEEDPAAPTSRERMLRLVAEEGGPDSPTPEDGPASAPAPAPAHSGEPCDSCPWCRGRRWARSHGPQMLRDLADAGDLLVRGLRSAARTLEERVDEPATPRPERHRHDDPTSAHPTPAHPTPAHPTHAHPAEDAPTPADAHDHHDAREQA